MITKKDVIPGSFRDPSGFVFFQNGALYRQVNLIYREHYDHLMQSGLYETLTRSGLLIPHHEVDSTGGATTDHAVMEPGVASGAYGVEALAGPPPEGSTPSPAVMEPGVVSGAYGVEALAGPPPKGSTPSPAYKILDVELVPFISYPYEWCFSQLKDAALATLKIQKIAGDYGMTLKDSSAYNIQFVNGKPLLIDTLSFEKYREGQIWVPYRQFCQHFLAPLALMSYRDIRLNQLLRIYLDGIPLDLASALLPRRTWLKPTLVTHLHLHAKGQKRFADKTVTKGDYKLGRLRFAALIDHLESAVRSLHWQAGGTEWANYYENTNYSAQAHEQKKALVAAFLDQIKPRTVLDLGANTGVFSRLASERGALTISCDIDPAAVEQNYLTSVKKGETCLLPLVLDLTNPSPGMGWENQERGPIFERAPVDTAMALALIHHLAISNNLPLQKIAHFFSQICRSLIIEFVPKQDTQVQRLLSTREDIFPDYTQAAFEQEFRKYFSLQQVVKLDGSERTLYLMQKEQPL